MESTLESKSKPCIYSTPKVNIFDEHYYTVRCLKFEHALNVKVKLNVCQIIGGGFLNGCLRITFG